MIKLPDEIRANLKGDSIHTTFKGRNPDPIPHLRAKIGGEIVHIHYYG